MMDQMTLTAEARPTTGSAEARRARRAGKIPAVIYGHKQDPVNVLFTEDSAKNIVHHRIKTMMLQVGDTREQVLVKDVQFDTFGEAVLHLDLERIAMDEKLELECPVRLIGEAKGALAGGVLEHPVSDLAIECLPAAIPEAITINISDLEIGDTIHVKDVTPPAGVTFLTDPDAILVTVHPPTVEAEEGEGEEEGATDEPEVIGRKKEDEDEDEA
jgi:large subunit ribosomal protein L25